MSDDPTARAGKNDEGIPPLVRRSPGAPETLGEDELYELIDGLEPILSGDEAGQEGDEASISHYELEIWDSDPALHSVDAPAIQIIDEDQSFDQLPAVSIEDLEGLAPAPAPDATLEPLGSEPPPATNPADYASEPGAKHASPRRDDPEYGFTPPVVEGPLALVLVGDLDDAWAMEAPLNRMGWRTTVRLGGDEALHAIHQEMPTLLVLRSWNRGDDALTFLRIARRFFPDIAGRCIAVACGRRGTGLHDVLVTEGVRAFIEQESTPDALLSLLEHMDLPTEPSPGSRGSSVLDQLTEALNQGTDGDGQLGLMPGSLFADRFVVEKAVGRGATATVYRVRDLLLQVRVALKVLSTAAAMDNALERFRREMLVCRELIHPNVVRTYDFGVVAGQPYYTMELLHGQTLDAHVGVDGSRSWGERPPLGERLHLMGQAFEGLRAVHAAQILHRDIKCDNVFVLRDSGRVKLVDFGVAKFEGAGVAISAEGVVLGTPTYLAPEILLDGHPASRATDIYGMGVVAWMVLVGRAPWESPDLANLMTALAVQPPPVPRELQPELTREASDLLLQLISRDPSKRPTDCGRVAEALSREAKKLGWRGQG